MPVRYLPVGAQHCCAPSRQDVIRPRSFLCASLRTPRLCVVISPGIFSPVFFPFFLRTLLFAFFALALSEFPHIGYARLFGTMTPLCPNSLSSAPQAL